MSRPASRFIVFASLLCAVAFISGCAAKPAAQDAVAQFHTLYNAGKFHEIYGMGDKAETGTGPGTSEEDAFYVLNLYRGTLGNVQTSELSDFYQHELFVDQPHVKLTYRTKFDTGMATETFRFHIVNGRALLIGYGCDSPQLTERLKQMRRP